MNSINQRLAKLSPKQRALLEKRLKQKGLNQTPVQSTIPKREDPNWLPLSFNQQRLWFLHQLDPNSPIYNISVAVYLQGYLNVNALEKSLNHIQQRHEILQTSFIEKQGKPVQVKTSNSNFTLSLIDLKALPETEQENTLNQIRLQEAQQPFFLSEGPLFRVKLLQLNNAEHIMLFTMHHIVADGWSRGILTQEMGTLYEAYCNGNSPLLTELPIQYPDFAAWQRQQLQNGQLDAQLEYWKHQLANPPVLQLSTDYSRPRTQTFRGVRENFTIPQSLVDALSSFSQQEDVTLFMTLLAALKVLLYRYTGQSDLIVGSPVAGRDRAELEGLIGFFVNMLVLRTDASGDPSFREFLKRVQKVTLDAYSHQELPFEKIVEALQPKRELNRNPLYQVSLTLNNVPIPASDLSELSLDFEEIDNQTTKLDLSVHLYPVADGLSGWFEYSTDLFHPDTITRMVGHWQTLLQGIVANPDWQISELPLLTSSEEQQILREWNQTQTHYPSQQCLHEVVETQVECTPDAIALVFEEQHLSYRELNAKANQVAHHLQDLGVRPEVLVGVYMERSLEMVIGLLGILKAGGVYLPLDPNHPKERISFMLRDAETPIVLTQQHLRSQLPEHDSQLIALDRDWHVISQQPTNPLDLPLHLDNLAYTIYTSGSTGQPKGVQIAHRALMNFLSAMEQKLNITAEDTFIALTPLSFDIAALELWLPLILGGKTVVIAREAARNGQQLSRQLAQAEASVMQATPASWELLLQVGWQGNQSLKLLCGGEALSYNLAQKLVTRSGQLWNVYGPTETTIWSTAQPIQQDDHSISIGSPILNTDVYVLDSHFQPVPIGVPGELYIGGTGLSRGYLNRPELTAEKFVPHPYTQQQGKRLYRTGDLVRYHSDGCLEYLGRIDNQIKLRGFRIELEELEKTLTEHPAVAQSVVAKKVNNSNDQQLVAYVVPEQPAQRNTESATPITTLTEVTIESQPSQQARLVSQLSSQLRSYLQNHLPDYMVPSVITLLNELPLTANSKVDRNALPVPAFPPPEQELTRSKTALESILADIWQQILSLEQVGIHDNFFELGGHSLLVTQLISRVYDVFQVELSPRNVFQAPTVASLSNQIEELINNRSEDNIPPLKRTARTGTIPLSFAQQRLWFLYQLDPDNTAYNGSTILRLYGNLQISTLETCFNEVIRRHEVLRTSFQLVDEQPVQVIHSDVALSVSLLDWRGLTRENQEQQIQQLAIQQQQRPFNLAEPPLFRVTLVQLDEEEYALLLTMHHIISDAWSAGIFVREIATLYEAFSQGNPSPLPELSIQYADFAIWQRELLQGEVWDKQLNYWKQQLGTNPPLLALPTDYATIQTAQGAKSPLTLSQSLTASLKTLSQQSGVTLFMTLLASFKTLLCYYTGQFDLVVGSPIANRNRSEIEHLIGFFVNTLVLRTDFSNNPNFQEILGRVREVALGAYAHQDLPFEKLVGELQTERNLNENPLFNTWFVLQNAPMPSLQLPELTLEFADVATGQVRHDLKLDLTDTAEGIRGFFEYKAELFESATIERMAELWKTLLYYVVEQPDLSLNSLLSRLAEAEQKQQNATAQAFQAKRRQKIGRITRKTV